jgi:hypothetical protein
MQLEASLDPKLRALLRLIPNTAFYAENRLEPNVGSEEGLQLFVQVDGLQSSLKFKLRGKSIYRLFVEETTKRCRLCGVAKGTQTCAVACVRSHINHRPFRCLGLKDGCRRCNWRNGYVDGLVRHERVFIL